MLNAHSHSMRIQYTRAVASQPSAHPFSFRRAISNKSPTSIPQAATKTRLARCSFSSQVSTRASSSFSPTDQEPPSLPLPYKSATPIPTRLNNIPHERETRRFFYSDISRAVSAGIADGALRLSVHCTIPELNTEFDVYRVGTLLELVREIATSIAADGKKVKVCVQQALGQGVFQGTPMSLSGVTRIMERMDWGEAEEFVQLGNLGAKEVESADVFLLVAPQNITGHSVLPLLEEMVEAAGAAGKPMVIINAKLVDLPASGGIMGVRGRQERQDFTATFLPCYHFRLLYLSAAAYPIMGALRVTWGGPWEVFKRVDVVEEGMPRREEYQLAGSFEERPDAGKITGCFKRK